MIRDFSGGLNTFSAQTILPLNQASDLQNINLIPQGGIEKRRGNTAFNSSAMASGVAVHGLGYLRLSAGTEFLVAVCGATVQSSPMDGTMTDRTGALTITTGADNIWTTATLNDIMLWAGGQDGTADAPFKWTGSGDATALGGSPPSGGFILAANNRAFIGDINSNRSRIQWSILGNPADWTGIGSGNQDVQKNDGDTLVGGAQLDNDHLLLFKQNSIHQLIIHTSPFPLFELFRGKTIGAVSKRGIVQVDGLIYYITPQPRMKATDGNKIYDFPESINDVWDGLNTSRLKYIQGTYYPKLRQIHWLCSTGSNTTHDTSIIWDVERKCYLRHPTGFKMNAAAIAQDRVLYTGGYDGKVYKQDVAATYADASETNTAINALWRSGWIDFQDMMDRKYAPYGVLDFKSQTTGILSYRYGYNFTPDTGAKDLPMASPGAQWDNFLWDVGLWGGQNQLYKFVFHKGRGNVWQFFVGNSTVNQQFAFYGLNLPMKQVGVGAVR